MAAVVHAADASCRWGCLVFSEQVNTQVLTARQALCFTVKLGSDTVSLYHYFLQ